MSLHPKGGFYQISQLWEVGCADVALLLLLQSLDNVNKVWEFINCVTLIGQSVVTFQLLLRLLKLPGLQGTSYLMKLRDAENSITTVSPNKLYDSEKFSGP